MSNPTGPEFRYSSPWIWYTRETPDGMRVEVAGRVVFASQWGVEGRPDSERNRHAMALDSAAGILAGASWYDFKGAPDGPGVYAWITEVDPKDAAAKGLKRAA